MSRRHAPIVAFVLTLAATVSACGVTRDGKARGIAPADVPFKLAEATSTTTTLPPTTTSVETTTTTVAPVTTTTVPTELVLLYFVQGERIVSELRSVPLTDGSRLGLERVLDQLVSGPTGIPGATTLVQPDVLAGYIGVVSGTVKLALGANYFALTPAQQVLALGQIVTTATNRPGVGRVQFLYAGQNADIWRGDTSVTNGEVSADDYRVLLSP